MLRLSTQQLRQRVIASTRAFSTASKYPVTQVTTLDNGMRVATEGKECDTATVGVFVDAGSRYENAGNNGVAHFLEHMFFNGTANRSRLALEKEIESIGGHLNAYTSREQTVFYTKVNKSDTKQAVDIMSDILQNSAIQESSIETERRTILAELEQVMSVPTEELLEHLHYTAYRNHPLGRTILGSEENIKSITKKDLECYLDTHYTAPRMILCGSGMAHEELVSHANEYFGKLPSTPRNNIDPVKVPARFTGSDIRVRNDDAELAHLAFAFPTDGWNDPESFNLMLLQQMLGNYDRFNQSSAAHGTPMMELCATSNGAVHSVQNFHTQYSDTGLFGIYGVFEPVGLSDATTAIVRSIVNFAYDVTPLQLSEAKNLAKLNVFSHLDGTTSECDDIGRQMLCYGRRLHPEEIIARIDAVDENAIKATARRYFQDRDFALVAMGCIYELDDYGELRKKTFRWV